MDLCAEKLTKYWPQDVNWAVRCELPKFRSLFSRLPIAGKSKAFRNADRMMNRWWTYPRFTARLRETSYFFHVVDHSYAHLAINSLRTERESIAMIWMRFEVLPSRKSNLVRGGFRKMSERILAGLQSAAVIFYSTQAVHADMLRFQLFDTDKLIHAPYGVDEEFRLPNPGETTPIELKPLDGGPWLLHVGGTIPRKRIDVLLQVFASVRQQVPDLKLCKLGSPWSPEQETQIDQLQLRQAILHLGMVERRTLVAAYQRASAVLVPSDAEGFGLPLIEATACGAPVIASDLPVLREIGGTGVVFAPVGEVDAWRETVVKVLRNDATIPDRHARLAWSSKFSWSEHARIIASAYQRLL